MNKAFERTTLLLGQESMDLLSKAHVLVVGVGGVGGYVIEALVRSGVGNIDLIDNDEVNKSNINRQIIATQDTVGKKKLDVWKKRIHSISPTCQVHLFPIFLLPENMEQIPWKQYDYVIDAIDTISTKIAIAKTCHEEGISLISSMGTGNKFHPQLLEITDLSKTSVCPLAKVMRHELRKFGITHLKVCYSPEIPQKAVVPSDEANGKHAPGSMIFVPATAGLYIAQAVIQDLLEKK